MIDTQKSLLTCWPRKLWPITVTFYFFLLTLVIFPMICVMYMPQILWEETLCILWEETLCNPLSVGFFVLNSNFLFIKKKRDKNGNGDGKTTNMHTHSVLGIIYQKRILEKKKLGKPRLALSLITNSNLVSYIYFFCVKHHASSKKERLQSKPQRDQ